jgi:hypothetical protein
MTHDIGLMTDSFGPGCDVDGRWLKKSEIERVINALRFELMKEYQKAQVYGSMAEKMRGYLIRHDVLSGGDRIAADPCPDEKCLAFVNEVVFQALLPR